MKKILGGIDICQHIHPMLTGTMYYRSAYSPRNDKELNKQPPELVLGQGP